MTVVELPRWTSELALAAIDAGIEIAPENGYTAEPTTVAMVVDAESPDLARRRVRDLLDGCGVRARYVVALSETRDAWKRAYHGDPPRRGDVAAGELVAWLVDDGEDLGVGA